MNDQADDGDLLQAPDGKFAGLMAEGVKWSLDVLLALLFCASLIGLGRAALDLGPLMVASSFDLGLRYFLLDALSVSFLFELFAGLYAYRTKGRIRLTYLLDSSLVFLLRELVAALYDGTLSPPTLWAYAGIVVAVGIVRTLASLFPPHVGDDSFRGPGRPFFPLIRRSSSPAGTGGFTSAPRPEPSD